MIKYLNIYAGNLFGGIETLLITLAKQNEFSALMSGHFALCFEGQLADELRKIDESKVHMLGNVKISRPWTVLRARYQLQELIKQEKFDVMICHSCWPQVIFGSVVKACNTPLVFWCHDTPKGSHWLERLAKQIKPDFAIANSNYTLAALPRLYPKVPSQTLYCPVPYKDVGDRALIRSAVRSELNTPNDKVVIIQASRLERWKGQTLLISALGNLRDLPNWVCWIAGGTQRPHEVKYLEELQAQARELKIDDRVCFLGQRSDIPHLLTAADIHCQPNIGSEPFGIAFIEAFYAGLPVVTTAMGAALEFVDDSCGYLVPPNNVNALSKTLAYLIRNPESRAALGENGTARADSLCNPQQQFRQLYDILSALLEKHAET